MIKAINDVVILEKTEEKTSDGGIYLSEKRKDEVELAKVLSIKEEDEIKEGMIIGYDPYDALTCSYLNNMVLVRRNKILFIWEGKK